MTRRWPWWLLVAGGLIMVALWPLFISLHGPTTYNEDRPFLGRDPLFWGAIMEGIPNVLFAAGLLALLPGIWMAFSRAARIGYVLLLVSLAAPAVADLVTLTIWPPLLYWLEAIGLALLAIAARSLRRTTRIVLGVMAGLLALTYVQLFLSMEQFDALEWYRIHGLMAHVAVGIGWAIVGLAEALRRGRVSQS